MLEFKNKMNKKHTKKKKLLKICKKSAQSKCSLHKTNTEKKIKTI